MALTTNKLAAATAFAAAFSLLAAPAAAVDLPRPEVTKAEAWDGDAWDAERDRRRRYRHRDRIDAGDVVAGVVLLGAIAAIAGAASNRRDRQRYENYPPPRGDSGYAVPGRYERTDSRGDSRGIDRAVDMCVDEVERGADRVGSVDSATRSAQGWHVSGELESGAGFACTIGNDGRIGDVSLGSFGYGTAPAEAAEDGPYADAQYDEDYYSRARGSQRYADAEGDDRYETARASDFE